MWDLVLYTASATLCIFIFLIFDAKAREEALSCKYRPSWSDLAARVQCSSLINSVEWKKLEELERIESKFRKFGKIWKNLEKFGKILKNVKQFLKDFK